MAQEGICTTPRTISCHPQTRKTSASRWAQTSVPGRWARGSQTQGHIYNTKLGTDKYDNSSCPCRWTSHREPTVVARSLARARRYMTPRTTLEAQRYTGPQWLQVTAQVRGRPQSTPPPIMRRHTTEAPVPGVSPYHLCAFWVLLFLSCFPSCLSAAS